jgi:hypothetical protein
VIVFGSCEGFALELFATELERNGGEPAQPPRRWFFDPVDLRPSESQRANGITPPEWNMLFLRAS